MGSQMSRRLICILSSNWRGYPREWGRTFSVSIAYVSRVSRNKAKKDAAQRKGGVDAWANKPQLNETLDRQGTIALIPVAKKYEEQKDKKNKEKPREDHLQTN